MCRIVRSLGRLGTWVTCHWCREPWLKRVGTVLQQELARLNTAARGQATAKGWLSPHKSQSVIVRPSSSQSGSQSVIVSVEIGGCVFSTVRCWKSRSDSGMMAFGSKRGSICFLSKRHAVGLNHTAPGAAIATDCPLVAAEAPIQCCSKHSSSQISESSCIARQKRFLFLVFRTLGFAERREEPARSTTPFHMFTATPQQVTCKITKHALSFLSPS